MEPTLPVAILACLLTVLSGQIQAAEDMPKSTELFFGKRFSNPNANNLLFGRRSAPGKEGDVEEDGIKWRKRSESSGRVADNQLDQSVFSLPKSSTGRRQDVGFHEACRFVRDVCSRWGYSGE